MMMGESHSKVQPRHIKRNAYLYVRQSTLRQVFENTESTKRQYDLRERAVALGWRLDQVTTIDSDLGLSGASAVDREGFQRLVSEVSMGRAGIVMGLEVSRLARNSTDWHRLLEICALADTLILDEDGVYDPAHFNDRLLLGLKGTMSEAELHILRARLRGGIINKARRGELEIRLPVGFDYDPAGRVRLDPDARVQESIRQFFRTFRRTGSATATVKAFRKEGLTFPHRIYRGAQTGELAWGELEHSRALWLLHHPRYTGAFCFGRTHVQKLPNGSHRHQQLPTDEWIALIRDSHAGYITWDEYEQNLKILSDNAQAPATGRDRGPAREGPALLQGLVMCAKCGDRMTVRYHLHGTRRVPDYVCVSAVALSMLNLYANSSSAVSSMLRSANCWCRLLLHSHWGWHSLCKRNWRADLKTVIDCVCKRWNNLAMNPIWHGVGTCDATQITAWLPIHLRPNGTSRCERKLLHRNSTTSSAKPTVNSTMPSVPASWPWPRTLPAFGMTRIRPTVSANAWPVC